jgi:hypothetical protein
VIEITLARIEYVKSVTVLLVNSDEPKVICLLFLTSGSDVAKRPASESSRQCGLMFEWVNRVILPMVSMTSGDGEMDRLTLMGVIK